jgi:hypothetical protein
MDEIFVDLHVYFSIFQIITKYRIYFEFWKFRYMIISTDRIMEVLSKW